MIKKKILSLVALTTSIAVPAVVISCDSTVSQIIVKDKGLDSDQVNMNVDISFNKKKVSEEIKKNNIDRESVSNIAVVLSKLLKGAFNENVPNKFKQSKFYDIYKKNPEEFIQIVIRNYDPKTYTFSLDLPIKSINEFPVISEIKGKAINEIGSKKNKKDLYIGDRVFFSYNGALPLKDGIADRKDINKINGLESIKDSLEINKIYTQKINAPTSLGLKDNKGDVFIKYMVNDKSKVIWSMFLNKQLEDGEIKLLSKNKYLFKGTELKSALAEKKVGDSIIAKIKVDSSLFPLNESIQNFDKPTASFDALANIKIISLKNKEGADVKNFSGSEDVDAKYSILFKGKLFEGGQSQSHNFVVGSSGFIDGFDTQMIGMKSTELRDVYPHFPEKYNSKDLENKIVAFTVKNNQVAKATTELGEIFFADFVKQIRNTPTYFELKRAKAFATQMFKLRKQQINPAQITAIALNQLKLEAGLEYIKEKFNIRLKQDPKTGRTDFKELSAKIKEYDGK